MPINLCKGCIGAQQGNLRVGGGLARKCEQHHSGFGEMMNVPITSAGYRK